MSDSSVEPGASSGPVDAAPSAPRSKKAARRKTVQFVVVFLVSILSLLTAYDMSKATKPDDWYLLQVAGHAVWFLDKIGYSCKLADMDRFSGKEASVRAQWAMWERGEIPMTDLPEGNNPGPPLTPWEAWRYQAQRPRWALLLAEKELARVRQNAALPEPQKSQMTAACREQVDEIKARLNREDAGPWVLFTLTPSPAQRLSDAEKDLAAYRARASIGDESQQKHIAEMEAEIARLKAKADTSRKDPKRFPARVFGFTLVPTCSAIQEMIIFFSAVLAFPALWRRKLVALLVGFPTLYAVNIMRLIILALVGALDTGGHWFHFAHVYVWQVIYIVFVVVLWMGWVEYVVRRKDPRS